MRILAAFFLLLPIPASAAEWWEAETAHFIIRSRASEADTTEFARQLEGFDAALRVLQNMPADAEESRANKPVVYRFGEIADIGKLAGRDGVGGFFIPRAGNSVAYVPARKPSRRSTKFKELDFGLTPEVVLYHEYTHYFMMQHFAGAYPGWYVEGFAELMSTIQFNEDGSFYVGAPAQHRASMLRNLPDFRLEDMLDESHEMSALNYYQQYGTGWLFTHYLSFDPQRQAKLRTYLLALSQGRESLEAAREIFGDLGQMRTDMNRYMRGRIPGYDVVPGTEYSTEVALRPLRADEEALIAAEMRLNRGVDRDGARDVANDIRGRLAGFPDSAHAQTLLAEAEFDAGNPDAAEQAAQRAVELEPNNVKARLYLADTALERSTEDQAAVNLARKFLAEATKLDPEDPRAFIRYYDSYYTPSGDIPEQAILALEHAFDASGSDTEYRLKLGRQLLMEDRMANATSVVLPVVFVGHSSNSSAKDADKPTPQKLLAALRQQDREQALAISNALLEDAKPDERLVAKTSLD